MAFKDTMKNAKKKGGKGHGFKAAVKNVQKGGKYSKDEAGAIVAEASRNASPEAKKKNPFLKKVK